MNANQAQIERRCAPRLCNNAVGDEKSRAYGVHNPDLAFPGEGERNQDANCSDDADYFIVQSTSPVLLMVLIFFAT